MNFNPIEIRNWQVPGQEQVITTPHPSVRLTNGVPSYLHRDHLGSVRAISDATGAKIESAVYKPFGEQTETLSPANLTPESKGWIGERYDADAGLQYLNARYYDPVLGMFLQPDWFEVLQPGVGTNRFSYSFNDPVNKLDPMGNEWYNNWSDFKGLFKGSDTTDSAGNREIRSAPIMRALVPGQVNWDAARTSWANGRRRDALIYGSAMLGETALAGATMGMGGATTQATGQTAKAATTSVVAEARLSQTGSNYAADAWTATTLKAGTRVVGGLPDQSPYYTTQEVLEAAKGSASRLWQSLQVRAHPEFGYRTSVGVYEVKSDTAVATGRALANVEHGAGGAPQYFINDFAEAMDLISRRTLGD